MRHQNITVAGYPAGQTNFEPIFADADLAVRQQLLGVVQRIADGIVDSDNGLTSLVLVGHSDRQDNPAMGCDEKRASEIAAARERGASAWEWVKARVTERLIVAGVDAEEEWWETASSLTWSLVSAAAGMLEHDPPAGEEERVLNRRVVFLVSTVDAG